MKEIAFFGLRELTEQECQDLSLRFGEQIRLCRPPQKDGAVRWLKDNRDRFMAVIVNTPPTLCAELFHAAGTVPVYSSATDRQITDQIQSGLFGMEPGVQKTFSGWYEILDCDLQVRDLQPGMLSGRYPRFLWISRHQLGVDYLYQLKRWCGVETMACWEQSITAEQCMEAAERADIVGAVLSMELLARLKESLGERPLLRLDFTIKDGRRIPRAWQELQTCRVKSRLLPQLC